MKARNKGFTLIELLIVIAIIGILAGIVFVTMGGAREDARIARARSDVRQLVTALSILEVDTNQWPGHQVPWNVQSGASGNEIWDLSASSSGITSTDGAFPGWNGPYMRNVPLDPWGNPYFLDTDYDVGSSTTIWAAVVGSFGPNGDGQNVYDADNIYIEITRE